MKVKVEYSVQPDREVTDEIKPGQSLILTIDSALTVRPTHTS